MMTPTEQVRAILEFKGWKIHYGHGEHAYIHPKTGFYVPEPDILHSLDACKEVFEKDAKDSYWSRLCDVAHEQSLYNYMRCGKATCAQRIEAYLRDNNLWKD